jgi:hypothetical protein
MREQLQKLAASSDPAIKQSLEAPEKELATLLTGSRNAAGAETEPGLDDLAGEAGALYAEVGGADAAPTAAQTKAIDHTGEEAQEALQHWDKFKEKTLPALNGKLRAANLPEIDLRQKPLDMPDSGDED